MVAALHTTGAIFVSAGMSMVAVVRGVCCKTVSCLFGWGCICYGYHHCCEFFIFVVVAGMMTI